MLNGSIIKAHSFRTGGTVEFLYTATAVMSWLPNRFELVGGNPPELSPAAILKRNERRKLGMIALLNARDYRPI